MKKDMISKVGAWIGNEYGATGAMIGGIIGGAAGAAGGAAFGTAIAGPGGGTFLGMNGSSWVATLGSIAGGP